MQLSGDDQVRVYEWLQAKCGALRCFGCGMSQWVTGGAYVSVGYDLRTTKIHYHEGIPQVSIVCSNCGYMMSFSTTVMGILPDAPEEGAVVASESSTEAGGQESS